VTIQEDWDSAKLIDWHFVTGDAVIDSAAKIQKDFSAFEMLDITVDATEIILEAKSFFESLKALKMANDAELAKIERAKSYDSNFFLKELMPALKAMNFNVSSSITKEDFVNNKGSIELVIKTDVADFHIYHDYNGYVEVSNFKTFDQDQRVTRKTRSSKLNKILEIILDAIETDKNVTKRIKEKMTDLRDAKQTLESALGIEVICKKEYHSNSNYCGRSKGGYETEYFIDAKFKDGGDYSCMKFEESSKRIDDKNVKGFRISRLPVITDMAKLKQIYELLSSV